MRYGLKSIGTWILVFKDWFEKKISNRVFFSNAFTFNEKSEFHAENHTNTSIRYISGETILL